MQLDFIIAGAAKCGTTALHNTISQLNKVSLPRVKETRFFEYDEVFANGLDWYQQLFDNPSQPMSYGEVAANYFYSDIALERIKQLAKPSLKIIVILRDPLDRLISEYKHHHRNGTLNRSLSYYLNNPDAKAEGTRNLPWHILVERSLYTPRIQKIYTLFPKKQIKLISSDFFKHQPQECINELCEFIQIEPQKITPTISNKAFTPRSRKLLGLINNSSILTKTLRQLIPSFRIRQYLRDFATQLNTSQKQSIIINKSDIQLAKTILEEHKAFDFKI